MSLTVNISGDQTIQSGNNGSFSVSVSGGSGTYSYSWYVSNDGGTIFTQIQNQSQNTYNLTDVSYSLNGTIYRCAVTDTLQNSGISANATLTVTTTSLSTWVNLSQAGTGNTSLPNSFVYTKSSSCYNSSGNLVSMVMYGSSPAQIYYNDNVSSSQSNWALITTPVNVNWTSIAVCLYNTKIATILTAGNNVYFTYDINAAPITWTKLNTAGTGWQNLPALSLYNSAQLVLNSNNNSLFSAICSGNTLYYNSNLLATNSWVSTGINASNIINACYNPSTLGIAVVNPAINLNTGYSYTPNILTTGFTSYTGFAIPTGDLNIFYNGKTSKIGFSYIPTLTSPRYIPDITLPSTYVTYTELPSNTYYKSFKSVYNSSTECVEGITNYNDTANQQSSVYYNPNIENSASSWAKLNSGQSTIGYASMDSGFYGAAVFSFTNNSGISSCVVVSSIISSTVYVYGNFDLNATELFSLNPYQSAPVGGGIVTITGANFNDATNVYFGSTGAAGVTGTATSLTAIIPAGAQLADSYVSVVTPYGTSATGPNSQFQYLALPTNLVLTPNNGFVNDTIIISGLYFENLTTVYFGNAVATINSSTPTSISVLAPSFTTNPLSVSVVTTAGGSDPNTNPTFTYNIPPVPTISSLSPPQGTSLGGTPVTITGTNFVNIATIYFGNELIVNYNLVNSTTITLNSSSQKVAGPDPVYVRVTTNGGTTADGNNIFTYLAIPAPTISSLSPSIGTNVGGTPVTITGTNFANIDNISFGNAQIVNYNLVNSTTITLNSPSQVNAGPDPVYVRVTTNGGTTADGNNIFAYATIPSITSISPNNEKKYNTYSWVFYQDKGVDSIGVSYNGNITNIGPYNAVSLYTIANSLSEVMFYVDNLQEAVLPILNNTTYNCAFSLSKNGDSFNNIQYGFSNHGPTGPTGATGPTLPIQGSSTGSILLTHPDGSVYYNDILQVLATGPTGYIQIAGDVLPSQNLTYSLGSTGMRWSDGYFGTGSVYIGNVVLSADGTTLLVNGENVIGETGPTGPTGASAPVNFYFSTSGNVSFPTNSSVINNINGMSDVYISPPNLNAFLTFRVNFNVLSGQTVGFYIDKASGFYFGLSFSSGNVYAFNGQTNIQLLKAYSLNDFYTIKYINQVITVTINGIGYTFQTFSIYTDPVFGYMILYNAGDLVSDITYNSLEVGPTGPTGATGPTLNIQGSSTGSILLTQTNGNVYFNNILQVADSGSTGYVQVSGDIIPSQNLTYSLGSTGSRWQEGYFGTGSVHIGDVVLSSTGARPLINGQAGAYIDSYNNSIFGNLAYSSGTTGDQNVAIGNGALYNNTIGFNNTALGSGSLGSNIQGSNNTAIGYGASTTGGNLSDCIILGAGAIAQNSGEFVVGSTGNPIQNVGTTLPIRLNGNLQYIAVSDSPTGTFGPTGPTGASGFNNFNYVSASGTYNVSQNNNVIACDTSSTGGTINLYDNSATPPAMLNIVDMYGNAGTNNITINSYTGTTIQGTTSVLLNTNYQAVTILSNGSGFWVIC